MNGFQEISLYAVDVFEVPVGIGDCSFHLLLKQEVSVSDEVAKDEKLRRKEYPPVDAEQWQISKVVLMDGGKATGDPNLIEITAQKIIDCYQPKKFGIDAWVVTHWDTDHCKGAIDWFETTHLNDQKFRVYSPVFWNEKLGYEANEKRREKLENLIRNRASSYKIGDEVLGMDFFSGESVVKPDDKPTLCTITSDGEPWTQNKPVMLCVGINGRTLQLRDNVAADKNETSIISITIWPNLQHIFYYTAGDGNIKSEKGFAGEKELPEALAMKASHHGAYTEFCDELFMKFKPFAYFISAAENSYAHPNPALLFKLFWLSAGIKDFQLYTSQYPYYLATDAVPEDFKPEQLEKAVTQIRDQLAKNKASSNPLPELSSEQEKTLQLLESNDKKDRLKAIRQIWTCLSYSANVKKKELQDQRYRTELRFRVKHVNNKTIQKVHDVAYPVKADITKI